MNELERIQRLCMATLFVACQAHAASMALYRGRARAPIEEDANELFNRLADFAKHPTTAHPADFGLREDGTFLE